MNIYDLLSGLVLLLFVIFLCWGIKRGGKTSAKQVIPDQLVGIDLAAEEKVRGEWLTSLYVFSAVSALLNSLGYFVGGLFDHFSEVMSTSFAIILGIFMPWLGLIPWFWITYHCSYKKRGTVWLLWVLGFIFASQFKDILKGDWIGNYDLNLIGWFGVAIAIVSQVYFCVNCFRLYRANSFRKRQAALVVKEGGQA